MKLVTFTHSGSTRIGVVDGEDVVDLSSAAPELPREMLAFVLENKSVDVCLCGVHTIDQMRHNFSASWTGLTPARKEALQMLANGSELRGGGIAWLEDGWLYA